MFLVHYICFCPSNFNEKIIMASFKVQCPSPHHRHIVSYLDWMELFYVTQWSEHQDACSTQKSSSLCFLTQSFAVWLTEDVCKKKTTHVTHHQIIRSLVPTSSLLRNIRTMIASWSLGAPSWCLGASRRGMLSSCFWQDVWAIKKRYQNCVSVILGT